MNGWIKWTTLYVYATGQSDFRFLRRSINVQRAWTTRVLKKKNLGGSMCKKNKILSLSASSTCALREDYEDSCFTRWRLPSFFSSSFSPSYFFSSLSPGATEAVLCLTFATMRNPLMYYTTTLYAREIFASFFSFFFFVFFLFFLLLFSHCRYRARWTFLPCKKWIRRLYETFMTRLYERILALVARARVATVISHFRSYGDCLAHQVTNTGVIWPFS